MLVSGGTNGSGLVVVATVSCSNRCRLLGLHWRTFVLSLLFLLSFSSSELLESEPSQKDEGRLLDWALLFLLLLLLTAAFPVVVVAGTTTLEDDDKGTRFLRVLLAAPGPSSAEEESESEEDESIIVRR